jgi:hypothetical protein
MKMLKQSIYLSGSISTSNWRSKVIEVLGDKFVFFNPQEHNLGNAKAYTAWDLHFVKQCNIVFAYMEKENPSGFGLTLEIGLANGCGKTIILVDEKSETDKEFAQRFKIVRETASILFDKFEDGLEYLKLFGLHQKTFTDA